MNISFGAAATSATSTFGAGTMSSTWTVHNNLVTYGFDTSAKMVTMVFVGGGGVSIQGGVFETSAGTNIFTNAGGVGTGAGTANFGMSGVIPTFS